MKFYDSKGLEVEILETDGGMEEAYVARAVYLDSNITDRDEEVPDDELDHLTEAYAEYCYQNELDKQISRAESWADSLQDR